MSLNENLQKTFKFSKKVQTGNYSIFSIDDIKKILYGKGSSVFGAAFGTDRTYNHFTIEMASPALDLLAEDILAFLSDENIETKESFDYWHHQTCQHFLNNLNEAITASGMLPMLYGKAQKALNMAMKYLYCCNDAILVSKYKKFDYCHIALDGYTFNGTKAYALSFYRDRVFIWRHEEENIKFTTAWSKLEYEDYKIITDDLREFILFHPCTFNDYLAACNNSGLFTNIAPLSDEENRMLTPFEVEFFLWEVCKRNKKEALTTLYGESIITSRTYLVITSTNYTERMAITRYLESVTPFDKIGNKLVYMMLNSQSIISVPEMLDDLVCLLDEHKEKLIEVRQNFNCKLELIARSPISSFVEKCEPHIISFANDIGAEIVIKKSI